MGQDRLLTLSDVSKILGLEEPQVRELIDSGRIPYYKIGGDVIRFKQSQIEQIKPELLTSLGYSLSPGQKELDLSTKNQIAEESDQRRVEVPEARQTTPGEVHQPGLSPPDSQAQSLFGRLKDFWYFYDFYIISGIIVGVVLFIIFRSIR